MPLKSFVPFRPFLFLRNLITKYHEAARSKLNRLKIAARRLQNFFREISELSKDIRCRLAYRLVINSGEFCPGCLEAKI